MAVGTMAFAQFVHCELMVTMGANNLMFHCFTHDAVQLRLVELPLFVVVLVPSLGPVSVTASGVLGGRSFFVSVHSTFAKAVRFHRLPLRSSFK